MTWDDAINYWKTSGKDDLKSARVLRLKKRHSHALFFCHLAIEKLLKGLIVKKRGAHPAPIHNLLRLAELAGLELDEKHRIELDEISKFNIAGRYDDYKRSFQKQARGSYATLWFANSERICRWLAKLY